MTRDAFADRLLDLAYGELSARETREVEAHATTCDACRAELARIRETRRLMRALPDEAPEAGGERILLAAARQAAEGRAPRRARAPWLWGTAAAAFSLVAVAAVSWRILAMRPGPLERPDSEALLGERYASPPPSASAPAAAPPGAEPPTRHRAPEPHADSKGAPGPARAVRKPAERGEGRSVRADEAEPAPERVAAAPGDGADVGTFGAPPPAAAAAPEASPTPQAKRAAPARAAPAPASSAPRAALREGGAPRPEVRTFEGCEGETLRRVERDALGRVVRYVREGRIAGRRVRIEHVYGADGALAHATVRDLDASGAVLDAGALGVALPDRAEDAEIDAPPRCGR